MDDVYGLAVSHRNVSFSYEKGTNAKNILDNVNVAVPRGTIYALLGPSGCGKTTLLKVTTGRIKSTKVRGDVHVFGEKPSSSTSYIPGPGIGYMPQELALDNNITVKETLWLFGKLNLMKNKVINERTEQLRKILDLPPDHKCVDNLSGGQLRRLSLATALLHNPPLLILDEPTVGVDPLLRKEIWLHLVNLTNTLNTTIIITTHYIEEAKDADIIGAMRQGRMLVEASPSIIMKTFNDNNLDSCFAKLCYVDDNSSEFLTRMNEETRLRRAESNLTVMTDLDGPVSEGNTVTKERPVLNVPKVPYALYRAKILSKKNMILIKRDKFLLIFQITVPIVTLILYCLCMGGNLFDVPIAVVNDEITSNNTGMADKFIQHLDREVVTVQRTSFDDAYNLVKTGKIPSFIHINSNFTECFHRRLELGLDVDNETIQCGQISSYFDMTNRMKFYILFRSYVKSYQTFFEEFLVSRNKTPRLATLPIDMTRTIYGTLDARAGEYMVAGIILIISHFMAAAVSVFTLITSRINGLDERLWVSGVTKMDVLLSSFAREIIVGVIQAILLIICVFWIFSFPLHGSFMLLLVLTVGQCLVGLAFGFLVSSIMSEPSYATILVVGFMFSNLLVGGILWPLEGTPQIVRKLAAFMPLTLPNEAFKAIMSKGWGVGYLVVNLGFVSSIVWFVVYMTLTVLALKYLN